MARELDFELERGIVVVHLQRIIRQLARVTQVIPLNEFMSSKRCSRCRPEGTNKTLDYLRFCPKTRTVTCPRCGYVGDKDTNAAANLTLVFQFYLLYRTRPRFLDAPYASKYQRACDPSDWSTESGSSESAAPRRVNSGTGSSDSEPDTGDDTDDIDDTDDTDDTGDTDDGMDIDDIDAADDDDDNDDVNGNNSTAQAAHGALLHLNIIARKTVQHVPTAPAEGTGRISPSML
jgi:hypothetical protein